MQLQGIYSFHHMILQLGEGGGGGGDLKPCIKIDKSLVANVFEPVHVISNYVAF